MGKACLQFPNTSCAHDKFLYCPTDMQLDSGVSNPKECTCTATGYPAGVDGCNLAGGSCKASVDNDAVVKAAFPNGMTTLDCDSLDAKCCSGVQDCGLHPDNCTADKFESCPLDLQANSTEKPKECKCTATGYPEGVDGCNLPDWDSCSLSRSNVTINGTQYPNATTTFDCPKLFPSCCDGWKACIRFPNQTSCAPDKFLYCPTDMQFDS